MARESGLLRFYVFLAELKSFNRFVCRRFFFFVAVVVYLPHLSGVFGGIYGKTATRKSRLLIEWCVSSECAAHESGVCLLFGCKR